MGSRRWLKGSRVRCARPGAAGPEPAALLLLLVVLLAACQGPGRAPTGGSSPPPAPQLRADGSTPSHSPPLPADLLLPNLRSLTAEDVHLRVLDDGRRELRFAALLANLGEGPLIVRPERGPAGCPDGQLHSSQVVRRENGDGRRVFPAGCMLDHPTHDHWHFDAMARYWLTKRGSQEPLVQSNKVSFCLRDSRRMSGERWADAPRAYGDCTVNGVQGISPGWIDRYRSSLPGQSLTLPAGLPDGLYCLRLSADPKGLLLETDEDDNATGLVVRITDSLAVARRSLSCR